MTGSLAAWLTVTALVGAASVATLVALALPRTLATLERRSPARRARTLTLLCLAPLAAGFSLAALCLLPSLGAAMWPGLDHCTRHTDHHLHLCLVHPPAVALSWTARLATLVGLAVVLARAAAGALRLVRANQVLARLHRASAPVEPDLRSVDTDAAFSFAGGLLRPAIYVSRGLRDRLEPTMLAAVLEHERAHVRRRDILRHQVARLGALLHGPGTARELLAALDLACEEACDEEAATRLGDRVRVAQALVVAARLAIRPPSALSASAVGFTGDGLTRRVTALLGDPARDPTGTGWILAGVGAALVASAPVLHHTTENILSLLAHP